MAETKMPVSGRTSIDQLPGNSYSEKEQTAKERPKMQKVVTGSVKTRKPSLGRKFADAFFGEDIVDVKSYIIQDVLVPTIKATISDIIGGGTEMLLFGRANRKDSRHYGSNSASRTPYTAYSNPNNQTGRARPASRSGYSVQEVVFSSRSQAEDLLDAMVETMRTYDGVVTVADFYDMAGVSDGAYTDHYWGWTDLGSASVRRVREGYLLCLPRPVDVK